MNQDLSCEFELRSEMFHLTWNNTRGWSRWEPWPLVLIWVRGQMLHLTSKSPSQKQLTFITPGWGWIAIDVALNSLLKSHHAIQDVQKSKFLVVVDVIITWLKLSFFVFWLLNCFCLTLYIFRWHYQVKVKFFHKINTILMNFSKRMKVWEPRFVHLRYCKLKMSTSSSFNCNWLTSF